MLRGRQNESLITGPVFLRSYYLELLNKINESRKAMDYSKAPFDNVEDALAKVDDNFCAIQELNGIYELETDNRVHHDNVSDHTKKVVNKLVNGDRYKTSSDVDKRILKFAAYLHDIGKGPKTKWENGIQEQYPDHPADAIPMLHRILSCDIKEITPYEIQKICLLVVYHDIIGDVINKHRSIEELKSILSDEADLNMLIAIGLADIAAIAPLWYITTSAKIDDLKRRCKN